MRIIRGQKKVELGKSYLDNMTIAVVSSYRVTCPEDIPAGMPADTKEYLVREICLQLLPDRTKKVMRDGVNMEDAFAIFRTKSRQEDGSETEADNPELATLRKQLQECRSPQPEGFNNPLKLLELMDQWLEFIPSMEHTSTALVSIPTKVDYVALVEGTKRVMPLQMDATWRKGCMVRLDDGMQYVLELPDPFPRRGFQTKLSNGTRIAIMQADPYAFTAEDHQRLGRLTQPLERSLDPGADFIATLMALPSLRGITDKSLAEMRHQRLLASA